MRIELYSTQPLDLHPDGDVPGQEVTLAHIAHTSAREFARAVMRMGLLMPCPGRKVSE